VRAVVTGGAGFIGSHVAEALLARGDEVTVVDDLSTGKREFVPAAATFVEADVREPLDFAGAGAVFHLAAQADVGTSMARPEYDAGVNVVGTVSVLEAARRAGAQVVFTSTGGAVYGEVDGPADEETPRRPLSAYAIAKAAGEDYLAGWNRIYGTQHVVLRLANVFGPRQDSSLEGGVVSIFLERLGSGEETLIFGDGGQTRDFVYVGDVVRAVLAAVGRDGGVYNVGTGVETSVNRLHELCAAVAGSEARPRYEPARPGDARRSVLDVARIRRELGWQPAIALDEGLHLTWEWLAGDGPEGEK
jgi:UDP-glucose 4-epimerase